MKKLLSMFMVIAIFLSVCAVPVFATQGKGSITITNATKDEVYEVYKIFDADVRLDANNNATAVTYKLVRSTENAVLFDELFGADGTKANAYFEYNKKTGEVKKNSSAIDTEVIQYLTNLVETLNYASSGDATATTATVKFENLDYGYYVITSTLGAAVTINSTTPDAVVIDKNQKPGDGFDKLIKVGERETVDENGNPVIEEIWDIKNSTNISDSVKFKVNFEATNYDGMDKIQYYEVHDQKGSALWVEFESIKVFVGNKELKRGYYLCYGDPATLNPANEWAELGDWGEETPNMQTAEWYLVHLGFDQFRIVIPWLEGHQIVETRKEVDGKTTLSYAVTYPAGVENANFLYTSPSEVVVTYEAGVEVNALIGGGADTNLFNKAWATWVHGSDIGTTPPETTETEVYGIGLTKKDGQDNTHLAGAEFRLYKDEACTQPVYVIPTNIDGVYILDSLNTYVGNMSGENRDTTRELYAAYLEEYLGEDYATTQDNLVTTQVNGKLVILGLAKGTYYLDEVKPPVGYNSLSKPYEITIDNGTSRWFTIFADEYGNVANITSPDSTHTEISYMLTDGTVLNSKGVTLPTTGAEGTMKLIATGSVITILCAVLLITQKKMSVYKD